MLNNTNRSHELVDLIAKVGADKALDFDFTNNEKLKESGFALNGKTVNGYVSGSGVTVNINSAKVLNSVVGHEITHVLEDTEIYTALESAVTEFAKTKGEYDTRFKDLLALYENVEGYQGADGHEKIKKELVADMVGDYLFTDTDFVNRLSTENRDIFDKIFDEVKYLCRVATAGSKEARQLEKVKKTFEDAYRQDAKNTVVEDGVRYSLASIEDITPTKEQKEENIRRVAEMNPVYSVAAEKTIPGDKSIKQIYQDYFSEWGGNIHSEKFGDIAVKNSSIRSEMRHGSTPVKVASIEAIPSVIQNGEIVEWIEKDSGLFRIVVAAPIKIGETPYYMGVMLQRDSQNQRLYLHDVVIEEEASNPSQEHLDSTGPYEEKENLYTSSILDKIVEVKRNRKGNKKLSLSSQEDMFPVRGGIYGKDVELEDIGPVREDLQTEKTAQDPYDDLPFDMPESLEGGQLSDAELEEDERHNPITTVAERLDARITSLRQELQTNEQNRKASAESYDQKIAELQQRYDGKKHKHSKASNAILRQIARQEELKKTNDAAFEKRINDIKKKIQKTQEKMRYDHTSEDLLEKHLRQVDEQLEADKQALAKEIESRRAELQSTVTDKASFISTEARTLYREIREHVKGTPFSEVISSLLDGGHSFQQIKNALMLVEDHPDAKGTNWIVEQKVRKMLDEKYDNRVYELNGLDEEHQKRLEALEEEAKESRQSYTAAAQRKNKQQQYKKTSVIKIEYIAGNEK